MDVVQRVQAPEVEVFVSQVTLWEMAIKLSLGRLRVALPELESGGEHRDPSDRLLVGQSRVEPMATGRNRDRPPVHNKARSAGPGRLSAQPWCLPKGVGRSCAVG
jgi:PIN domain nuclease of toxin-antitoxin system